MKRFFLFAVAIFSMHWPAPRMCAVASTGASGPRTQMDAKAGELLLTLLMTRTGIHVVGLHDLKSNWWNGGYGNMLDTMRRAMPRDAMLTTEFNGEPFVRWFDGYLAWHWQHDGQVPAFPAIYGGVIQMFGRAYRSGATKDIALRMKAGQQLVFGEQIGWIGPGVAKDPEKDFFRRVVELRHQFRRYFYAGEMARPPKLIGDIPTVKTDWQWSGEWWVTTDAVLTGAWRLPEEKRLALFFANVSGEPVNATSRFDSKIHGIESAKLPRTVIEAGDRPHEARELARQFEERIQFQPRSVQAWELSW